MSALATPPVHGLAEPLEGQRLWKVTARQEWSDTQLHDMLGGHAVTRPFNMERFEEALSAALLWHGREHVLAPAHAHQLLMCYIDEASIGLDELIVTRATYVFSDRDAALMFKLALA